MSRRSSWLLLVIVVRGGSWWLDVLLFVLALEELLVLQFLFELGSTRRVQACHFFELLGGEIRQVPDKVHQLPGVGIVCTSLAPCRHAGQSHSVFNDPIQLAIGQF